MEWAELGDHWLAELVSDPTYEEVVTPLLLEVLDPEPNKRYLDLGCGDGRVMRVVEDLGATVHGVEINLGLAKASRGRVIAGRLPDLQFIRQGSYDGVYCVLALEHIEDHDEFFLQTAGVVTPGGVLALVMNHPVWTAPGSTPISDSDGEVLWRPGEYFSNDRSEESLGTAKVSFHHRPMSELLNAAASAGWRLDHAKEAPHHELSAQRGIPRLFAGRWLLHQV